MEVFLESSPIILPKVSSTKLVDSHFFEVQLDLFDGPVDLLLHLVKQNELPIEKISLSQVTDQYLKCIEAMKYYDLEMAGEYLVIAATLLSIKSSVLLNRPVELVEDEEGNLVNPHEELLRKLREAAIYKEGARHLGMRDLLGLDVFSAASQLHSIEKPQVSYRPHDALLLGRAFKKLVEKAKELAASFTVVMESISIVERMRSILSIMEGAKSVFSFRSLVPGVATKGSVVASFVALLELCKRQVVVIEQATPFDEMRVSLASERALTGESGATVSGLMLESEFDDESGEGNSGSGAMNG